jgi:hypothetical protein
MFNLLSVSHTKNCAKNKFSGTEFSLVGMANGNPTIKGHCRDQKS